MSRKPYSRAIAAVPSRDPSSTTITSRFGYSSVSSPSDQRPVAGHVLQAGEVGAEPLLRFEVDVEADQVQEGEVEVLGRGIVDVGDEGAGILRLDDLVQPAQIPLDPAAAQPAHDGGRDL